MTAKTVCLALGISFFQLPSFFVLGSGFHSRQEDQKLEANQPVTFALSPGTRKSFSLSFKEDDFAEFVCKNESAILKFALLDPSGKDLLRDSPYPEDSISIVAPKTGLYRLVIGREKSEGETGEKKITLEYHDKLKLPVKLDQDDKRTLNGYEVRLVKSVDEEKAYLLIKKNGRLKTAIAGTGAQAGGFTFKDDSRDAESPADKSSALLFKNTPDKTGDGVPDIAVEYYSGGAHCCFSTLFFELGPTLKEVPALDTQSSQLVAIGKNPNGGLRFATYDQAFAYWLTSFAESPSPRVVLEFRNGGLIPNFDLMRKAAPTPLKLKAMAAAKRAEMNLEPYTGVHDIGPGDGYSGPVFWDVMIDLIYTGHEDLAWKFLELVWPPQKKGKELFISDFKSQLGRSQFWQAIKGQKAEGKAQ
jgi:hypothetical protein